MRFAYCALRPRHPATALVTTANQRDKRVAMNAGVRDLLQKVGGWPEEDQQELAELAREIEARRTGVYVLSDEERAAIAERGAERSYPTPRRRHSGRGTAFDERALPRTGVGGSRRHLSFSQRAQPDRRVQCVARAGGCHR